VRCLIISSSSLMSPDRVIIGQCFSLLHVNQYLSEMTADGSERENSTEHTNGREIVRGLLACCTLIMSAWTCSGPRYNCRFSAASLALQVIFVHRTCPLIYALCLTISRLRTEQPIIMGFGELAAVD